VVGVNANDKSIFRNSGVYLGKHLHRERNQKKINETSCHVVQVTGN
jgi:hypothetical protein